MKKNIITLFALLCALLSARAQYESFFGQESWEYSMAFVPVTYSTEYDPYLLGCMSETYRFNAADTVSLNGYTYYYWISPTQGFPKLREDTTKGQLFVLEGDTEVLLCDMSLNTGDTFTLTNNMPIRMIVDSVTYLNQKKHIHLTIIDLGYAHRIPFFYGTYNFSLRFMEGIGPMYGPILFDVIYDMEGLMCLHKDDTLFYMTHPDVGCWQEFVSVPEYPETFLTIYPNPSYQQIYLEFSTEEKVQGTVFVRDMVGRVCRRFSVNDRKTALDVSALPQGVYMLTFVDQKNRTITKKIVKQ